MRDLKQEEVVREDVEVNRKTSIQMGSRLAEFQ